MNYSAPYGAKLTIITNLRNLFNLLFLSRIREFANFELMRKRELLLFA